MTGIALTLASVALVGYDVVTYRATLIRSLSILTAVVGENSIGALSFGDANAASAALAVLRTEPQIDTACIFDHTGKVFASYHRVGTEGGACPPGSLENRERFHDRHSGFDEVTFDRPITFDGETIGSVYVHASLRELLSRLIDFGGAAVMILLACSVLVIMLSGRLQRIITWPILNLLEVTKDVSVKNDYTIRAKNTATMESGCWSTASTRCSIRSTIATFS